MNCPKCDTVYLCACGSCASRHTTESTWKFEGDLITCPCGFSMHCDENKPDVYQVEVNLPNKGGIEKLRKKLKEIREKVQKVTYNCQVCGQSWAYNPIELSFAEQDNCCHECVGD